MKLKKPVKAVKPRKLTLWIYEPDEMAELREGVHQLRLGNYWDFHAGCSGTKMLFKDGKVIDFKKEWNDMVRTPMSVAQMVALKIGATVDVKYRKTPIEC